MRSIRQKLRMLKEIERRNLERIEAFRNRQKKGAFRREKRKAGKKDKPREKL